MSKLISVSLTDKQWNVLEVALDRFIDEQVDDGSEEATEFAKQAKVVKVLMQNDIAIDKAKTTKFEVMLGMPTFEYRTVLVEAESPEHAQEMVELDIDDAWDHASPSDKDEQFRDCPTVQFIEEK